MSAKVLDSFALIAYFRDEPGAEMVEDLLVAAGKTDIPLHMTDVNFAERYLDAKFAQDAARQAEKRATDLAVALKSADTALTEAITSLLASTQKRGSSAPRAADMFRTVVRAPPICEGTVSRMLFA